jgi:hypothetical protein
MWRRVATHTIAASVGFWAALALEYGYRHNLNAPSHGRFHP